MSTSSVTWEASVIEALYRLGGEAHLSTIYDEVERLRKEAGLSLSATFKATIRRTVQQSKRIEPTGEARSGVWRLVSNGGQPQRA